MLARYAMRMLLLLTFLARPAGATGSKAFPNALYMPIEFTSGFDSATETGYCGEGFDEGQGSEGLLKITVLTKNQASKLSLQEHGVKVVSGVWPHSVNPLQTAPKATIHAYTDTRTKMMHLECRRSVWAHAKENLLAHAPTCWPERGYLGKCGPYGNSEEECTAAEGCQWNPATNAILISDTLPQSLVRGNTAQTANEGGRKEKKKKAKIAWSIILHDQFRSFVDRLAWPKDKILAVLDGELSADKLRLTEKESLQYLRDNFDDAMDTVGEDNSAYYRRSGLDRKISEAFMVNLQSSANLPGMFSAETMSEYNKAKGELGLRTVAPEKECSSASDSFPKMHIDTVLEGLRGVYHASMDGVGEERRVFYKYGRNKAKKRGMLRHFNPKRTLQPGGDQEDFPAEYFLEMANFWSPLEAQKMMVNPLGFRVDAKNIKRGISPMHPKGRHACPKSSAYDYVDVMTTPLVATQGWLFWTRYVMHSALPIHDLNMREEAQNCRTSVEFRFWFVGLNPPRLYVPSRALLDVRKAQRNTPGVATKRDPRCDPGHLALARDTYRFMRITVVHPSLDKAQAEGMVLHRLRERCPSFTSVEQKRMCKHALEGMQLSSFAQQILSRFLEDFNADDDDKETETAWGQNNKEVSVRISAEASSSSAVFLQEHERLRRAEPVAPLATATATTESESESEAQEAPWILRLHAEHEQHLLSPELKARLMAQARLQHGDSGSGADGRHDAESGSWKETMKEQFRVEEETANHGRSFQFEEGRCPDAEVMAEGGGGDDGRLE